MLSFEILVMLFSMVIVLFLLILSLFAYRLKRRTRKPLTECAVDIHLTQMEKMVKDEKTDSVSKSHFFKRIIINPETDEIIKWRGNEYHIRKYEIERLRRYDYQLDGVSPFRLYFWGRLLQTPKKLGIIHFLEGISEPINYEWVSANTSFQNLGADGMKVIAQSQLYQMYIRSLIDKGKAMGRRKLLIIVLLVALVFGGIFVLTQLGVVKIG